MMQIFFIIQRRGTDLRRIFLMNYKKKNKNACVHEKYNKERRSNVEKKRKKMDV